MFCSNCGEGVSDGVKFCPKCGAKVGAPSAQPVTTGPRIHRRGPIKVGAPSAQPVISGECSPSSFSLFSFSGRVTRARWWGTNVCIYVGAFLAMVVGGALTSIDKGAEMFLGCIPYSFVALFLVVWVIATALSLSVDVRRFHDIDKSGWMLLLFWALSFVPLVGSLAWMIKLFMLAFADGTMGPNRYGADPKGRQSPYASHVVVNNQFNANK